MKKIKLMSFLAMGMVVFALNSCSGGKTDAAAGEKEEVAEV